MSTILEQKSNKKRICIPNYSSIPSYVEFRHGETSQIHMKDGSVHSASCISCAFPKCMVYEDFELTNDVFSSFPADLNKFVCTTGALTWEQNDLRPSIQKQLCINCGACALRCAMGAIFLTEDGANVSIDNDELYQVVINSDANIDNQNRLIQSFNDASHEGNLLTESDDVFSQIYDKINTIKVDAQFPNILTRNLFLSLGVKCSIRRRGDVYLRMDAILGLADNKAGIAEVEFTKEVLESPRAILDDIAVLTSKYDAKKEELIPVIVYLCFPNIRTDYWRVINDIRRVLGVEINTMTIGAMMLLAWNRKKIDFITKEFYVDIDSYSIRTVVEQGIGRKIKVSEGHLGIFEVSK